MTYLDTMPQGGVESFYTSQTYRARYGPVLGKSASAEEVFMLYSKYQDPIIERLKGVLKKDMRVLDVGCSAGQFLHALKGKVKKRVGLELSADAVAFIRERKLFPVYDVPIEQAAITEGPFDLITCLQTLEHVERPVEFLRDLGRNLTKNGYLYLELPNIDDALLTQYHVKGYEDFYFREPHLSYFSRKTLRRALDAAGFKGTIGTVQRYNFLNHIHWMQTGMPQATFMLGNDMPQLVEGNDAKSRIGKELNIFIQEVDARYKRLLEKQGLGESLTFLGKKVK